MIAQYELNGRALRPFSKARPPSPTGDKDGYVK
jgi:hypothetical protein